MDLYNLVFSRGKGGSDSRAAGNWYHYDWNNRGILTYDYLIDGSSITDWAAVTALPSPKHPSLTLGIDLFNIFYQLDWSRENILELRPHLVEIYNLLKEHELLSVDAVIYTVRISLAEEPMTVNFGKMGTEYHFIQTRYDGSQLMAYWGEGAEDFSDFRIYYASYPYADDITLSDAHKAAIQSKLGIVPAPTKHIYTRNTGTLTITLEDNAEYEFNGCYDVHFVFPFTPFKSHIRFNFGTTVNVVFPADAHYIGIEPQFEEMTAWEVSVKDGVIVAGKIDW